MSCLCGALCLSVTLHLSVALYSKHCILSPGLFSSMTPLSAVRAFGGYGYYGWSFSNGQLFTHHASTSVSLYCVVDVAFSCWFVWDCFSPLIIYLGNWDLLYSSMFAVISAHFICQLFLCFNGFHHYYYKCHYYFTSKTDSIQSSSNTCKNYLLKIYSQHANFLNAI